MSITEDRKEELEDVYKTTIITKKDQENVSLTDKTKRPKLDYQHWSSSYNALCKHTQSKAVSQNRSSFFQRSNKMCSGSDFVILQFRAAYSLKEHFIDNFMDTLKVGVPAFIYTIQNFLLYLAIEHLEASTYMVTYQLKILTTALFTVIMLKRRLSILQWVSLIVLMAGIVLVQYSANQEKQQKMINLLLENTTLLHENTLNTTKPPQIKASHEHYQNPIIGLVAVITACFLSGFAGIYFEKILKGSDVSLWLRNVQLAALSIPIGLVINDGDRVYKDGLMQGFDMVVWAVVLLQALGGLIVAVVIKYADNILKVKHFIKLYFKAFATSIAIVVSCVASIFLFQIYPTNLFIAGATLVIAAVVIYGVFPYKNKSTAAKLTKDIEMQETNAMLNEQRS